MPTDIFDKVATSSAATQDIFDQVAQDTSVKAKGGDIFDKLSPTDLANKELAKSGLSVSAPKAPTPSNLGGESGYAEPPQLEGQRIPLSPESRKNLEQGAAMPVFSGAVDVKEAGQRYGKSFSDPDYTRAAKERENAGTQFIGGAMELASPVIPSAISKAPLSTIGAMGAATGIGYGADKAGQAAGMSPEGAAFTGAAASAIPFGFGIKRGLRGEVLPPEVAAKPELAAPQPPTIEAPNPVQEATAALVRQRQHAEMASRVANGQPPVPAPKPAGPEVITPDHVAQITKVIAEASPTDRPKFIAEAHEELTKWMSGRQRVVNPVTHELTVIDSPKQASATAAKWINDAVKAHETKLEQAAKENEAKTAAKTKQSDSRAVQPVANGGSERNAEAPKVASVTAQKAVQATGDQNATSIAQGMNGAAEKTTQGEPVVPIVKAEDGKISAQLKDEKLHEAPPLEATPEELAKVGTKDPETGRTIVQPKDDHVLAQEMATQAAPEVAQRIEKAVAGLHGAKFERARPEKKPERTQEKVQDEKEPVNTIGDLGAEQVVVESREAKEEAIKRLEKEFKTVEPTEDYFEKGKKDKGGYRAVSLQVQASNGASHEIQIVPRELYDIIEQTHAHYAAARDAKNAGDMATHDREMAIADKMNDEAWAKFQARNDRRSSQRSESSQVLLNQWHNELRNAKTPEDRAEWQAKIDEEKDLARKDAEAKAKPDFSKGSKVTFIDKGKEKPATVKYHNDKMGIVRVQADGEKGTRNVKIKDVRAENSAPNLRMSTNSGQGEKADKSLSQQGVKATMEEGAKASPALAKLSKEEQIIGATRDVYAQDEQKRANFEHIFKSNPEALRTLAETTPEVRAYLEHIGEYNVSNDRRSGPRIVPEATTRPAGKGEVPSAGTGETGTRQAGSSAEGSVPAAGKIGELPTSSLSQDPHRFQYKSNTDAKGTSALLKETTKFNPDLAGLISVWQDPADGKVYVVNGHHRLELAQRTGHPDVAVRHIKADTAKGARALGALQNISEGRGTVVDAAKFLRDSGMTAQELKDNGLSMGEATAAKGVALSKLDDSLFNAVVQGDMPVERAVTIGEATDNHAEQKAIAELIEKKAKAGKNITNEVLGEMIRFVKGSETTTETTQSLFGEQQVEQSLALEKAEVSTYIKQQLAKDKKLFSFVSKDSRANELERGNNIIDVKNSQKIAEESAQGEELYNKLSNRSGPIADILDDAAKRLAEGGNAHGIKQEAYNDIRTELAEALGTGARSSLRKPAGTPARAKREASLGGGEDVEPYRQNARRGELDWAGGLTDDQVSSWSKSRSLSIVEAGEQNTLFGEPEKMYKFTRTDADGQPESALVSQTKVDKLLSEGNKNISAAFHRSRQMQLDAPAPEYGSRNKFITKEDADKASDILKSKTSQLNSGFDPEALAAVGKLAAYHFEAGAREFTDWSKAMLKDAGEAVRPHLRALYDSLMDPYRPAAIWKLKSEDIINQKMAGPMSGEQLSRMLRNNGIKPDEMKWTGLDDLLKDKAKITPEEVTEHLRQNNVQVKEVMKGAGQKRLDFLETNERRGKTWTSNEGPFDYQITQEAPNVYHAERSRVGGGTSMHERFDSLVAAKRWFNELREESGHGTSTKFAAHTLPGGSNYRELLLTLPTDHGENLAVWKTNKDNKFRSGHFDEPNVLAHVRFNDRVDADGKKVLFLEEVQSDWHQKGRRQGYAEDNTARIAELKVREQEIEKELKGLKVGQFLSKEKAARHDALSDELTRVRIELLNKDNAGKVPDAPFKKDWHELALKRMLRYAAENGYDKLAWTTGEVQNDRYDLSKQVDKIYVGPQNDGSRAVRVDVPGGRDSFKLMVDKDGIVNGLYAAGQFSGKPLADVVGKDVAERIMGANEETTLSGENLRIGGSGMKGFYNKIIPDFLNKYGKKWNASVGETKIAPKTPAELASGQRLLAEAERGGGSLVDTYRGLYGGDQYTTKVPAISITPEMRQSVLKHGQYLYAGVPLSHAIGETLRLGRDIAKSDAVSHIQDWIKDEHKNLTTAKGIQNDFYDMEQQYQADILRGVQAFKAIGKVADTSDLETVYHSLEDPSIELTPKQQLVRDSMLKPMMDASRKIYTKLTDGGMPVENYVHRVVEGKGNLIDRMLQGVTGNRPNVLSKYAPQTRSRSMMAIVGEDGQRKLVSVNGNSVSLVQRGVNGERINKPLGTIEEANGERLVSVSGKPWKLTQATTKEIEAQTDLKYYKNAAASTVTAYLNLRKAERAFDYVEQLKASPEFKDVSWKKGESEGNSAPDGWKPTELQQLQGYSFEPHVREALDWYAKRARGGDADAWDKIGRVLTQSIFFNPLLHVPNVLNHWVVEKGVSGVTPDKWRTSFQAGQKAIKAVATLNKDYLEALDSGAPLQAHRYETEELQKLFFETLGKDKTLTQKITAALGEYANPYRLSGKVTWNSNDVLFMQSVYEKTAKGMPLKEAITETAKHIPDYRLPTRILNSRVIGKMMENRKVTMFGAYHYGALKSYGEMVKEAVGSERSGADRAKALDHLAMLGIVTFLGYKYIVDPAVKAAFGNKYRMRRAGASTLVDNIANLVEGKKDASQVAQSVVTPAVHSKTAAELMVNRDFFTGKKIYGPAADGYNSRKPFASFASQFGKKAASAVAPVDMTNRVMTGGEKRKAALLNLIGVQKEPQKIGRR